MPVYFPHDYFDSRQRFRDLVRSCGGQAKTYQWDCEVPSKRSFAEPLSVDVGLVRPQAPQSQVQRTIVISSGLHGVEGFVGAAIQLALLERLRDQRILGQDQCDWVLIHALNPFGYAAQRRVNEQNIDLNRNFLLPGVPFDGAPALYAKLDSLLNPTTPPQTFELFRLRVLRFIMQYGLRALKDAIATGQYEFPRGLFYGGKSASWTKRLVEQELAGWIGEPKITVHIDIHSGLGQFGDYRLLLGVDRESTEYGWFVERFGEKHLEPLSDAMKTAYRARGVFGEWCQQRFSDREFHTMMIEFGTYDPVRMLRVMRDENRAYHACEPTDPRMQRAQAELVECFCPAAAAWREAVVASALDVIQRSLNRVICVCRHAQWLCRERYLRSIYRLWATKSKIPRSFSLPLPLTYTTSFFLMPNNC